MSEPMRRSMSPACQKVLQDLVDWALTTDEGTLGVLKLAWDNVDIDAFVWLRSNGYVTRVWNGDRGVWLVNEWGIKALEAVSEAETSSG